MIMFVLNNKSEWMRRYVLENKVFNFIGRISYGIYLYHYTFGPWMDDVTAGFLHSHPGLPAFAGNFYFIYCIKLTALITLCWLSFKLIEQPILGLKKRFEYTKKGNGAKNGW
jgi:peptidoglycan/LPS O-acetylase OafA/YrhL